MITVATVSEAREVVGSWHRAGESLSLVPTMGALHEGHLSLVDRGRRLGDRVAVSIFVNPLQFAEGEDLERYPRTLAADLAGCEARGVDLAFHPSVDELYPLGEPLVTVDPGVVGDRLCGLARPGHFRGVLTVVAKLFGILAPGVAVFGQKDYQQSVLIRAMVADLNLPVRIEVAPIVREADGLALSSRNHYLSPPERAAALAIPRGLDAAAARFKDGVVASRELRAAVQAVWRSEDALRGEYIEVVDAGSLESVEVVRSPAALLVAARVGSTRLIDNLLLHPG